MVAGKKITNIDEVVVAVGRGDRGMMYTPDDLITKQKTSSYSPKIVEGHRCSGYFDKNSVISRKPSNATCTYAALHTCIPNHNTRSLAKQLIILDCMR